MNAVGMAPWWGRALRIAFAALGLVALICGPIHDHGSLGYSLDNHFSYFTIQSNILGVIVLLVGALRDPINQRWQLARGASTLYLIITGIVYAVLLAHIDQGTGQSWVDDVLHRIMPIAMIADWALVPVAITVNGPLIAGWLAYPVGYGTYTLFRGASADWYPYPFIDPRHQGYVSMAISLVVLVVAFALLAVAVAALGDLSSRWRGADE
ncbi:Pr6Pr family membrane protein [Nocardia sp. KC 131]|uniref:Pr6Pr family membrane protein n=1 Tax=Nocardia arseniciresistens TaxID=3392119 RepID=UPI00398F1A65